MELKHSIEATCPECRGPLSEVQLDAFREYRCLVGHAYSARTVLQAHSEVQEKALWSAVVALEESANLVRAVKDQFPDRVASNLETQSLKKLAQARELRAILEGLEVFETE